MGSEQFYPEERPIHPVSVDGSFMDRFEVTVADFRRFVQATGYVTVAERPLNARDYPGVDPALIVPGSLVFQKDSRAELRRGTAGPDDPAAAVSSGSRPPDGLAHRESFLPTCRRPRCRAGRGAKARGA
jgi:formylglycine-generating enzyme required for sulfatase activity